MLVLLGAGSVSTFSHAATLPDPQALYDDWKARFVTGLGAGGNLRVVQNEDRDSTISEGQGYGMLLAVYLGDRPTFDKLWAYTRQYLDERGLMHWHISASGVVIGENAATDGDEDIAYALLVATKRWGVSYGADTRAYIDAIYEHEVEQGTYVLKPGDVWGGSLITNPSYCAPAYYRDFATFTGEEGWYRVLETCYDIIARSMNQSTGLVPDWTTAQGGSATALTHNSNKDNFSYNAIRVPWRLALDWHWHREARAYAVTNKMTSFFATRSKLYSGYTLPGSPTVSYFDTVFAAGIAGGASASSNQSFETLTTDRLVSMRSSAYYGSTLRVLTLLMLTDNFPDLVTEPVVPPEEPPVPPTDPVVEPPAPPPVDEPTATSTPTAEEPVVPSPTPEPEPEPEPQPEPEPLPEEPVGQYAITVELPGGNSTISGEKKIKAFIPDIPLSSYSMTYSVDSRTPIAMQDSGSLKQAKIQFDTWDWLGSGPYEVVLEARNLQDQVIGVTQLLLSVKH